MAYLVLFLVFELFFYRCDWEKQLLANKPDIVVFNKEQKKKKDLSRNFQSIHPV